MITINTLNSTYEYDDYSFTLKRVNHSGEPLRRDEEPIKILGSANMKVGQSAIFYLDVREDGIPTLRTTSIITGIEYDS